MFDRDLADIPEASEPVPDPVRTLLLRIEALALDLSYAALALELSGSITGIGDIRERLDRIAAPASRAVGIERGEAPCLNGS